MKNYLVDTVKNERFQMDYIRFGKGKRPFVILPGISLHPIAESAGLVAENYWQIAENATVFLFERKKNIEKGYTVEMMAEDTACAMIQLGIANADLLGVSQGGVMAQYIAAKHPELVRRVAIGSSAAHTSPYIHDLFTSWRELALKGNGPAELNRSFFRHIYSPKVLESSAEQFAQLEKRGTDRELAAFAILADAMTDFDVRPLLPNIHCPAFVLGAQGDRVLLPEGSLEIAELLSCPICMYEGYSHAVYDEAPDYRQKLILFFDF